MTQIKDNDHSEFPDVRPPEYKCDFCSTVFIPIKAGYPCPNCHKPSTVKVFMNAPRTNDGMSLVEIIERHENEENKVYTLDSEFPNFVLDTVAAMKRSKREYGSFSFQPLTCGTGLTLSIRQLRNEGSYPAFIGCEIKRFYDFFEDKKDININEAIEDYFKNVDYLEYEYLKINIKDIILEVYEFYLKDKELRSKGTIKSTTYHLKEKINKRLKDTLKSFLP